MHWRHCLSKLIHLLDTGPHFRILADETGGRITTINSIHHSWLRSISLDHFTHGTTQMPGQLSMINGASTTGAPKCSNQHRWCTDTHRHSQKTSGSFGTGFTEATQESPENQFGQMPIQWLPRVLPRIHTDTSGNQARRCKAMGHKEVYSTFRRQVHSLFCGVVQLLSQSYPELRHHCCPTVQTHPPRLQIHIRTLTKSSSPSLWNTPDTIMQRTGGVATNQSGNSSKWQLTECP